MFKKLTENGHHVTLISHQSLKGMNENYREILLNETSIGKDDEVYFNLSKMPNWRISSYLGPTALEVYPKKICPVLFTAQEIRDLWERGEKFDLVILQVFETECVYQLAKQFNCPVIATQSAITMSWAAARFGMSINPSYIPNNYMLLSGTMNFWQRVENTVITFLHHFYYKYVMMRNDKATVEKYFGAQDAAELEPLGYNTSLYLVNTHYTVHSPRPLVPSAIEVGGIHIGKPEALPKVKYIHFHKHVHF